MDEYPKMLYRHPATGQDSMNLEGAFFDTCAVKSAEEEAAANASGWFTTWPAARQACVDAAAAKAATDAAAAQAAESSPVTRAELEQKARELNIQFDGRTSDKKLGDLIRATLET